MRTIHFKYKRARKLTLEESDDMFVVRTTDHLSPDSTFKEIFGMTEMMPYIVLADAFPEPSVFVYKIVNQSEPIGFRDELKEIVRSVEHQRIKYIGTVMKYANSGIYQLYTGNIFLKFHDDVETAQCERLLHIKGLKLKSKLGFGTNVFFVEPVEEQHRAIFDFAEALLGTPEIEMCHPELVTQRKTVFDNVAGAKFTQGDYDNWVHKKIKLAEAWRFSKGKGIRICVIDDGIDFNHPAFSGSSKIPAYRDMYGRSKNIRPDHQYGERHGTPCAGIACSADPRVYGVAPEAQLLPVRSIGLGSVLEAQAFYWAVENGADVISCSWGPPDGDFRYSTATSAVEFPIPDHTSLAIEYAAKHGRNGKGCPIFFAAGNGNEVVIRDHYASHERVLAIGSSNKQDEKATYSDYGHPLFCVFPSGDYIEVNGEWQQSAGVLVPDRIGAPGYSREDIYTRFTGTSASCPGMAGIAALALSLSPNLTQKQLKNMLRESCKPLGFSSERDSNGIHRDFGYGLIQADQVVSLASQFNFKNREIMNTSSQTTRAFSLHIGINNVSNTYYQDIVPPLFACVNDKDKMLNIAKAIGYQTMSIQNASATRERFLTELDNLANTANPGDIVLITYAGHGAPLEDKDGDEGDGSDEAWLMYDGFLLDDEINAKLRKFKEGVRVVLVSDSCHSGSMGRDIALFSKRRSRAITKQQMNEVLRINNTSVRELRSRVGKVRSTDIRAWVKTIGACTDKEVAYEDENGGNFTSEFLLVYEKYKNAQINYEQFVVQVRNGLGSQQTPQIENLGPDNPEFNAQFPLSIVSDGEPVKSDTTVKENTSVRLRPTMSLLVESEDNYISIDSEAATRSTNTNESPKLNISDGSVSADEVQGQTDWDRAYNLILSDTNNNVTYVEPDTISNIYKPDTDAQTTDRAGIPSTGDRIDSYPPANNDLVALDWHLDFDHSQLKAAREFVFPELISGDIPRPGKRLVKIVHIDTGFIPHHPAHPQNLEYTMSLSIGHGDATDNPYDDDRFMSPAETQGHGNATMAILAGGKLTTQHTNGKFDGYFGAIPFARVYSIKISESVILLTGKKFAKAVDYAISIGADVITMSMAGWPSRVMANAVNRAYKAGIVIVSAAGNSWVKGAKKALPDSVLYPARFDRTIAAVGAAYNDVPYVHEYHNKRSRAEGGEYMQMSYGPPSAMKTAIAAYTPNLAWFAHTLRDNGKWFSEEGGGTSSATPQVAACAALYIQHYRDELHAIAKNDKWKIVEITKKALFRSALKHPNQDYHKCYGNGILKAYEALQNKPGDLAGGIEEAKKARVRGFFLTKLFSMYRTRGLAINQDSRVNEMMMTELMQLMYREPELYQYLKYDEHDEKGELTPEEQNHLASVIRNSNLSSNYLKAHIRSSGKSFGKSGKRSTASSGGLGDIELQSDTNTYLLRTAGLEMRVNKFSQTVESEDEIETQLDEIEIDFGVTASRGGERYFKVNTDFVNNNRVGLIFMEHEINGVKSVECVFSDGQSTSKPAGTSRSMNAVGRESKNEFNIDIFSDPGSTSSRSVARGIFGKVLLKVVSWAFPVIDENLEKGGPERQKIFESWISSKVNFKYEIVVYSLKTGTKKKKSWKELSGGNSKLIKQIMADPKPLLLCMPGLASTAQGGFTKFLNDKAVRKHLSAKFSEHVIGLNMPTIADGIDKNAKEFSKIFRKMGFAHKECCVLARSRGGILARYLFEDEWIKKNGNPTSKAPFILKNLVMVGTPNEGTPIADDEKWTKLIQILSTVLGGIPGVGTFGMATLQVIATAIKVGANLPGIDHLELESKLIEALNENALKRLKSLNLTAKMNYYSGMSNYEPKWPLKAADQLLIDKGIFGDDNIYNVSLENDTVVPVKSGIMTLSGKYKLIAESNIKLVGAVPDKKAKRVTHFEYLKPKKKLFIEWVLESLG